LIEFNLRSSTLYPDCETFICVQKKTRAANLDLNVNARAFYLFEKDEPKAELEAIAEGD